MELAKLVKTALDETRMLVLGAQILLGFELSGVFRDALRICLSMRAISTVRR